MLKAVYKVTWTEYERGWGQRPDGYTLCASKPIAEEMIQRHWDGLKEMYGSSAPDIYSRPSDNPFLIEVDDSTYEKVMRDSLVYYP